MLTDSRQILIKDLNRFEKRKKEWDTFFKHVETNASKNDKHKEFNVSNLCDEVGGVATVERRAYRACRKYKASEKRLIYAFESYEYKRNYKKKPISSVNRKRKKGIQKCVDLREIEEIPAISTKKCAKKCKSVNNICTNLLGNDNKFINPPVLNGNENVSRALPKISDWEHVETGSSGYFSMANSRRQSLASTLTIYESVATEIIEAMLVNIRQQTKDGVQSKYLITMEIIRNLSLVYDLPRNNLKYICLYLKQTKFNIDLSSTVKLVHIIEDIKQVKLKNFIFGMRLLETLDRMTDLKFKELSDKVNKIISDLFRVVDIDVIKIYIDFILWMFDYKKPKLN